MQQQFLGLGISFGYPDDWTLSEELGDDEVSITVTSPESAFWSATILRDRPDPEEVLQSVVEVFRLEYDECDVVRRPAMLAGREVPGAEIDFICLEMTNTARLRAFRTQRFTVLILYQFTDAADEQEDTLEAISESLHCEGDVAESS